MTMMKWICIQEPPSHHRESLRAALAIQFKATFGYALFFVLAIYFPGSVSHALGQFWVSYTTNFVDVVLFAVPKAPAPADPGLVANYRHILASCLLITGMCFFKTAPAWDDWARNLYRKLTLAYPRNTRRVALAGYRVTTLGLFAAIFMLLFIDSQLEKAWLYSSPWTFLRAPVLSLLTYTLACNAVALKKCINSCDKSA